MSTYEVLLILIYKNWCCLSTLLMIQQQALKFQGRIITKETSIFLQKDNVLKEHSTKTKLKVAENLREPVW